jgi:hypothetical protein
MTNFFQKTKSSICIIIFSLALLTLPVYADVTTKKGFLDEVKAALESSNAEALLKLYAMEGSPPEFVTDMTTKMPQLLKSLGPIRSVLYAPMPASRDQPFTKDGVLWGPNVKTLGVVVIQKKEGGKVELPYGKLDGRYCFPGVKKIGEAATDGGVQIDYAGFGRQVSAKLNGKPIELGSTSGSIAITGYCRKGLNKLVVTWKPKPGEKNIEQIKGYVTVVHRSPDGKTVRLEKKLDLKAAAGQSGLDFTL